MTWRRIPLDTSPPQPAAVSEPPAESVVPSAPPVPLTPAQVTELRHKIIDVLCTCFDPEVPVNIYELGLIYGLDVSPLGEVAIQMTLTTPACPVAGSLPPEVQRKVQSLPGVRSVKVDVVWDPPWDKSRMSEAARLQLGIDD